MCNLRYMNKIVNNAIVCHSILNPALDVLVRHLWKRKGILRQKLPVWLQTAQED